MNEIIKVIVGKWYVIDCFSGPISGPFDTKEEAEADRDGMNIADDCFVARRKAA